MPCCSQCHPPSSSEAASLLRAAGVSCLCSTEAGAASQGTFPSPPQRGVAACVRGRLSSSASSLLGVERHEGRFSTHLPPGMLLLLAGTRGGTGTPSPPLVWCTCWLTLLGAVVPDSAFPMEKPRGQGTRPWGHRQQRGRAGAELWRVCEAWAFSPWTVSLWLCSQPAAVIPIPGS